MAKERRSEKLSNEEYRTLMKWIGVQETKEIAAEKIGVSRQALHTIILAKSCKPATARKIREAVNVTPQL